jgi:hypothetical protein
MNSSGANMLPRHVRNMGRRAWKVVQVNWHLGVTAFGGPPVHFRIVSDVACFPNLKVIVADFLSSSTKSL